MCPMVSWHCSDIWVRAQEHKTALQDDCVAVVPGSGYCRRLDVVRLTPAARAAENRNPDAVITTLQTVKEYVRDLQKKFPGLAAEVCDKYIRIYENARFSNDELDEKSFLDLMKCLLIMIETIER